MTDVVLPDGKTDHHFSATGALRGIATSILLFSIAMLSTLLLSRTYILPRVAEVEVKGVRRSVDDLATYYKNLLSDVAGKEQEREASVMPIIDSAQDALKTDRRSTPSFLWLREELFREAAALVPEEDAIHLSSISYDAPGKTVVVSGDVRNVGTRSMTVLAAFATSVGHLPFVKHAEEPSFERQEDSTGGVHSPFTFTLELQ